MAWSPSYSPRRQDSIISSVSSGSQTIREDSSHDPIGFFARLTGRKGSGKTVSTSSDSGYSLDDAQLNTERSLSPRPATSPIQAANAADQEDSEAGPSDYWRRSPSPRRSVTSRSIHTDYRPPQRQEHGDESAKVRSDIDASSHTFSMGPYLTTSSPTSVRDRLRRSELADEEQYERRMRAILATSTSPTNSDSNGDPKVDSYFHNQYAAKVDGGGLYSSGIPEASQGISKQLGAYDVGEEEFGESVRIACILSVESWLICLSDRLPHRH